MGSLIWPVESGSITSGFGQRQAPTAGASTNHAGVDISVPSGTAVYSAAAGTVKHTGSTAARGNYMIIDHGGGLETIYQHLSGFVAAAGQTVRAGQKIALSGNTGVSTGAHLHFEVRQDGRSVDPLVYTGSSNEGGDTVENAMDSILAFLKKNWVFVAVAMLGIAILRR